MKKIKMISPFQLKKIGKVFRLKTMQLILVGFLLTLTSAAQTEISGVLDNNPADGISDGISDGTSDVMAVMYTNFIDAVHACRVLVHNGNSDWYLPSIQELWLFCPGTATIVTEGLLPANYRAVIPSCVGANCDKYINRSHWTRSIVVNRGHDDNIIDYMGVNLLGDYAVQGHKNNSSTYNAASVGEQSNKQYNAHGYAEGKSKDDYGKSFVRCVR